MNPFLHHIEKDQNGEILKGARSPINTRMEGSICELLAAEEANKENQALKNSKAKSQPRGWKFHFEFSLLYCQENLPQALT